ncbi:exopolysaccharide biosynthesis protein [Aquihabitans sp. G128]|uniref:exopolysaccharide biosynthesis protein n=1 Tax=Aquihabitans sp. G128 TaxID=2849779 RepID=UPI001C237969|nr:exopolysaccharide biosynthesis protein [Aquihabitans sp. G128]QXC62191.1 exopolysaccharide biosynthesis protein [Aquihabitans sp. G128]
MTAIIKRRDARNRLRRAARRGVSHGLEEWLEGDEPTTLGTLNDAFGEKILAAACLALMAPSALPIPTGGATHVFDVIAFLFAVQMVVSRKKVWLPVKWRKRELGKGTKKAFRLLIRFVKQCERISKPRLRWMLTSRVGESLLGIAITVLVVGAFISPPFSGLDTLPSLAVVVIALGILLDDGLFAIGGLVIGVAGLGLTIGLGLQASHLFGTLF